jgi:DNA-binding NtrC family response regulator
MKEASFHSTQIESMESPKKKVLFIDDDRGILNAIGMTFDGNDSVICAECHSIDDALKAIENTRPDIIFLDNTFSGEGNEGLKVADQVKERWRDIRIYSTTGDENVVKEYSNRGIKHVDKRDVREITSIISGRKED